jgi:hypothetical protein
MVGDEDSGAEAVDVHADEVPVEDFATPREGLESG